MTLFRFTAGALIAVASLVAVPLLMLSSLIVGSVLQGPLGSETAVYVVALGWLIFAPVVLLIAAATLRRTAWSWVICCTVQLIVMTAVSARFEQWLGGIQWPVLLVVIACGVASIAAALRVRDLNNDSVGSSATASPGDVPPSEGD